VAVETPSASAIVDNLIFCASAVSRPHLNSLNRGFSHRLPPGQSFFASASSSAFGAVLLFNQNRCSRCTMYSPLATMIAAPEIVHQSANRPKMSQPKPIIHTIC
jgi:hypothetical protein